MTSTRPAPRAPLGLLLLLLAAAGLPGCASPIPAAVSDSEFVRVTFWDFRTDAQLILVTENDPEFEDLYSQPREDANIKLTDRETLADLIEFAGDRGFFDYARPLAEPDEVLMASAKGMIVIRGGGQNHAFVFEHNMGRTNRDSVAAFTDIQTEVHRVYNSVRSLQFISTTTDGRSYFEEERARIQRENAARTQGGAR